MCEQLTAYLVLQSLVQFFFPFVKKSMECWWERIIPRQSITPNRTGSPGRSFVQYYANNKKIKKHKQHLSDRNCVVRHRTLIFCPQLTERPGRVAQGSFGGSVWTLCSRCTWTACPDGGRKQLIVPCLIKKWTWRHGKGFSPIMMMTFTRE